MEVPEDQLELDVLACALASASWGRAEADDEMRALAAEAADPRLRAALAAHAAEPLAGLLGAGPCGPPRLVRAGRLRVDDGELFVAEGDDRCLVALVTDGRLAGARFGEPAPDLEPADPAAVAAALAGALAATPSVDQDATVALPLLERLLTGAAGAWPRPALAPEDVFGERDVDLLCDAFAGWLTAAPAFVEDATVVAATMIGFKLEQGASEPVDWTPGDVREYLEEYSPWVTDTTQVGARTIGRAAVEFLLFLEHEALLTGPAEPAVLVAREWLAAQPERAPALPSSTGRRRRERRKATRAARRRNRH